MTTKKNKSHKEPGKIRNQDMATLQSGAAILNWLWDKNEYTQLLEEISKEDIIDLIRNMKPEEQQQFIKSFC